LIKNSADLCRTLRLASLLGGVVLGLGSTSAAHAQLSQPQLFLHWPGINGSAGVLAPGDIALLSYSQNASHNTLSSVCGPITVTKAIDIASPAFLELVFTHRNTPSGVTITFTTSAKGGVTFVPFYTVTLDNVYVNSVTQTDPVSSNGITTETVIFSASKFTFKSTPTTGGNETFSWDCVKNQP
jgi:type VI protein secretion system component Hcp